MKEATKIEWTWYVADDGTPVQGFTVNAWWGCAKVSDACKFCYAETLANRYKPDEGLWSGNRWLRLDAAFRELDKIKRRADADGHPRRVFIESMSDWCEDRDDLVEPRKRLIEKVASCGPRVVPLWLTKREDVLEHVATARVVRTRLKVLGGIDGTVYHQSPRP